MLPQAAVQNRTGRRPEMRKFFLEPFAIIQVTIVVAEEESLDMVRV